MKIGSFIASGLHSFSIVEERGFIALMKCAVPNFTVPSRTTSSRSVVPELYSATRHAVHEKLQSILKTCAASIAITTDGWTSRAGDSFVAVTCHVLSEEFEPHNFVLACRSLRESHTASNLRSLLQGIFMDWGISDNLPCFVVTDNARNFVSAIQQDPWVRISCFAHTLQLCVQDAKKETIGFANMCAKARTIVGYYKRSSTARARLQDIQKQLSVDPPLELVQDVPTRWNSEFAMLARLLKLKTAVTIDLTENDSVENLTNGEWRQVSAFVTVLQPVEEATTAACAESYPTLSLVVPLVHCMKLLLCDKTSDCDEYAFTQNLLKSINARFPAVSTTAPNCLATLLDPRFKDVCYGDEEKVEV